MSRQLSEFFALSDADRAAMGRKGRDLVEAQFTWTAIAARFRQTYAWTLGGGQRPDFVELGR